jgi:hypothetical protein
VVFFPEANCIILNDTITYPQTYALKVVSTFSLSKFLVKNTSFSMQILDHFFFNIPSIP